MENINVAIPLTGSETNMSAEEFQNLLSSWFEEKGIISDLRSQLRYKMINVLKNTVIGRNISKRTVSHHSLSKQAINLIVAEFLMQNKCHYSLSVFNTEAALTNIFPEYLRFDNSHEPFRYSFENLSNIFELIGVSKNSEFGKEALHFYCNNTDSSILSCIVSSICNLSNKIIRNPIHEELKSIDFDKESNFVRHLGSILDDYEKSSSNVGQMMKNIESTHDIEMKMVEEKYRKSIDQLKTEISGTTQKLQEVNKSRRISENKLQKVVREYNAMKIQMKNLLKEKLQREKELQIMIQKEIDEKNTQTEQFVSEPIAPACSSEHCNKCEENMKLVEELQEKNRDSYKKTERLSEELLLLSKKYNEHVEQNVMPVCSSQHCSDMCEKNRNLVDELREKNRELYMKNETQSEELCQVLRKYNEQIVQNITPVCSSKHCSFECEKNMNLVENLREKIRELAKNSEVQSEEIKHLLEKYNEQIIQKVTPVCSVQHCSNECMKHMNLVDELREKNHELSRKSERDSEELYCLLRKYKEQLIQKASPSCSSRHCSDKCEKNMNLVDELQEINQQYSRKSEIQSEELFQLSMKYKELLHDFLDSQRKISFLKAKANTNENFSKLLLNKSASKEGPKAREALVTNSIDSDSSTSVTEEILREARLRLQILEEESNKIEEKYKNTPMDSHSNL